MTAFAGELNISPEVWVNILLLILSASDAHKNLKLFDGSYIVERRGFQNE